MWVCMSAVALEQSLHGWVTWHGLWKSNSGPLQEQHLPSTAESSFQPLFLMAQQSRRLNVELLMEPVVFVLTLSSWIHDSWGASVCFTPSFAWDWIRTSWLQSHHWFILLLLLLFVHWRRTGSPFVAQCGLGQIVGVYHTTHGLFALLQKPQRSLGMQSVSKVLFWHTWS